MVAEKDRVCINGEIINEMRISMKENMQSGWRRWWWWGGVVVVVMVMMMISSSILHRSHSSI